MRRDRFERAGQLLDEALKQDSQNAKAGAWKALWHVINVGQGWTSEPSVDRKMAQELAFRAVKNDPESAEAHAVCGHVCAFLEKDFDSAVHYFDVASRLNPNIAFLWAMSAATYCYLGQPDVALKNLARYQYLASLDPTAHFWDSVFTTAYNLKGDYEQAYRHGRRFVRENPDFSNGYKPLIAALGHLGRREAAAPYIEKLLELEPHFTIARFIGSYPFARQEDRDNYARGLELAGVPKG